MNTLDRIVNLEQKINNLVDERNEAKEGLSKPNSPYMLFRSYSEVAQNIKDLTSKIETLRSTHSAALKQRQEEIQSVCEG